MIIVSVVAILLGISMASLLTEQEGPFYRDFRFWMITIALLILLFLTLQSCSN
jgi:hypothetical protein